MYDIYKLQDLHIDDVPLKKQYYNNIINNDIASAKAIYNNNPQLQGKVIASDMLNKLLNSIISLETLYYDDVVGFLANGVVSEQEKIDQFIYLGDFSVSTQYEKNNFVLYNNDIYLCLFKPEIGTLPTNVIYWYNLGLKGATGNMSLGVDYRNNWVTTNTYNLNDVVTYNNDLYVSKTTNQNSQPDINPTDWLLSAETKPQIIGIGLDSKEEVLLEILEEGDRPWLT